MLFVPDWDSSTNESAIPPLAFGHRILITPTRLARSMLERPMYPLPVSAGML
jgi:hypothetical protein